jgi:hypothetical protein
VPALARKRVHGGVLAAAVFAILAIAGSKPASAQDYHATLKGVTFTDGGTASGSFGFDLTGTDTGTVGNFNLSTSSNGRFGYDYSSGSSDGGITNAGFTSGTRFYFYDPNNFANGSNLFRDFLLDTYAPVTGDGTYALAGFAEYNGFDYTREVNGGELVIGAVPEASSMISFGLLLLAGGGLLVWRKRTAKAA